MNNTAAAVDHTLDSIIHELDRFHQRATYAAVAGVVDSSPRSLMTGRTRDPKTSWIVSRRDGLPTGYQSEQTHPEIQTRAEILDTPEALRCWLQSPI
ncbi:MAG: hypothetical protein ABIR58_06525 [Gemmatimonadaceae bacterium]